MRLTIIAPDSVYEHEVDPSMEVQDLQALIEAEVSQRSASFKAGILWPCGDLWICRAFGIELLVPITLLTQTRLVFPLPPNSSARIPASPWMMAIKR